ncbi:DNA-binding response OmpR family regulator [Malaciobacter marinus]|jgi:DNA-binding response OmpR family regulator|uniref:DNA-binding response OmpR family regulator n=1 Tax=Malaciobacter marinus TaxID=505249 RepID=A0AB36ZY54_9BACT|nr:response regulator transcription factor [Malaciobacter marinus]PPK60962.1 DNA-binding response OmpR family regulator [Malaciobacter marinus]SKB43780.1 DNA-binding response regulator, OmpR family, contains REC and winged-helix (wHTH) domain [Malaciobacter marinus]
MDKITTRVLLVEDEEDAREILSFYLDTIFDEVQIACDGQEGLNIYKKYYDERKSFDLVLTDIKMPNKDGLTMVEDITRLNDEQKFIIVSAYKDEEYLFKSIGLNIISYFVKPLEIKTVMEILKKVKSKVLEDKSKNENLSEVVNLNKTYSFNTKTNLLYKKDELIHLSKKETLLLKALITNIKQIKTKEFLKKSIWNDTNTSDATMRTVIKRVKDKISDDDFISSIKGLGYIIE